jgi:hypothetical protein
MKVFDCDNNQRPLRFRSSECRPTHVRTSQKTPFETAYQNPKCLARRFRALFRPSRQLPNLESGAAKTDQSP